MSQENGKPPEAAIDSHAEEIQADAQPQPLPPPEAALALAPRPPAEREVLMPLDPQLVVEGMRQYQRLLRDLLEPSDWQTEDKHGRPLDRPFLKKSGWRKIARAFNLSFERVRSEVERDEHGNPIRAEVWIRAVAPNGQYGDGDGYCSLEEGRFRSSRGRAKLENDLRATATTRAKNRAIADLVGMGEVSAEEIEAEGERRQPAGTPCDQELARVASRALVYLSGDNEAAQRTWNELSRRAGGQMPAIGAQAIVLCARALRGRENGEPVSRESVGRASDGAEGETQATPAAACAVEPLVRLLELARRGGYRPQTIRALCVLLYERESIEQLAENQLADSLRTLGHALAGGVSDRELSDAVERCAVQPDSGKGGERLGRWLAERASRKQRHPA